MGADEHGQNYYYNWVTGESRYDKPEGWYPAVWKSWLQIDTFFNNSSSTRVEEAKIIQLIQF